MEFASHVCCIQNAVSSEFESSSSSLAKAQKNKIIDYLDGQAPSSTKGASMRLGSYPCHLKKDSRVRKLYGDKSCIFERHRHRFQFSNDFKKLFEEKGMTVSGVDHKGVAEIVEIPCHPWFIGVQFHPEFQSKPLKPHILFSSFISASL